MRKVEELSVHRKRANDRATWTSGPRGDRLCAPATLAHRSAPTRLILALIRFPALVLSQTLGSVGEVLSEDQDIVLVLDEEFQVIFFSCYLSVSYLYIPLFKCQNFAKWHYMYSIILMGIQCT